MTFSEIVGGDDIVRSIQLWKLWTFMSWQDVRQRYRGSVLGPFWIAGSVAVVTLGAGSLYASLLKVPAQTLLPYISLSISLWLFISLTILESCNAFLAAGLVVRNMAMPLGIYVLRVIYRNLIVLAHSIPVVILVFALFHLVPSPVAVWAVPGFLLLVVNLLWMAWIAALLAARFPDVGQIIGFGLQFAIFVTPIFWRPEQAGPRQVLLTVNPFNHLMAIVRGPIIGELPTAQNWTVSIVMAVVGVCITVVTHRRLRHEVVFWV